MAIKKNVDAEENMCVTIIKYLFSGLMILGVINYIVTGQKPGQAPKPKADKGFTKQE
jgi:hypothetical protein